GAFGLTQSHLNVPTSSNPEYHPSVNWFLNGNLLGDNHVIVDTDGVQHVVLIPYTGDTLIRQYTNNGDVIRCLVTSNHCATPDSSNSITMAVLAVSTGGTIMGPSRPCPYSDVTYHVH